MIAVLAACALSVIDGDTVRCGPRHGGEVVRLLGIDAPEMPGHCRRGRACAPGDPFASKASLQAAVRLRGRVTIERHGRDRYGRTLAFVRVGRRDRKRPVEGVVLRTKSIWARLGVRRSLATIILLRGRSAAAGSSR